MGVEFHDFSIKVKAAIDDKVNAVLEGVSGELESQVKLNFDTFPRVDTGKTKNSFQHKVVDSELTAYIGSNDINALYEEFGTGEFALKDNGRKGGWYYEDAEGNGHFTHGKKPSMAFWNAYTALKEKIVKRIEDALKGL